MDFGRPHRLEEGVVTKSNIRVIPIDDAGGNKVDEMVISCANNAAIELFLGPPLKTPKSHPFIKSHESREVANVRDSKEDECAALRLRRERRIRLADARLFPERCLPQSQMIFPGSLVVIFESFDSLDFAYAKPNAFFANRNGRFSHDDFIGKPFGCKIRSRSSGGLGFCYILRPTPELWSRSLNHRTQIIHELDAAVVIFQLNIRPNNVVCESGTGSGAMSHAILRTIAPCGKLHTFEFNRNRVEAARKEFEKNGLDHLVEVHWRDVCGKRNGVSDDSAGVASANLSEENDNKKEEQTQSRIEEGGFGLGQAAAHAIFLDLPSPWLAVPHAAHTIVPGGRIGSYSPCIEQTQRLVATLGEFGFHSIRTQEVRLREHYVDEVELDPMPTGRLPRNPPSVAPIPSSGGVAIAQSSKDAPTGTGVEPPSKKPRCVPSVGSEAGMAKAKAATEGASEANIVATNKSGKAEEQKDDLEPKSDAEDTVQREVAARKGGGDGSLPDYDGPKKEKLLVARPFGTMRGHTAFLTFATADNRSWPDPNERSD
jgi:tRNA (adenine57-N1/adenine58-N1)-methyltransferase